ncbi:MAG TPA: restriction endonuclease subunit S, partial [Candidatus Methanoperedens sp.]
NLIQIPLPPLPIQRRIVSILEKAEETKKLRAQADELTERLLKSLFFDMFGDPVKNPKGWETKMIRDIADIIVPTRDKPKKFDGDIPWVTLPDVLSTALFVNDSKYKLSTLSAKEVSARLFPKDTVLLSCAGTLGRVAIAKCALYSNQQFYGLVCKTDKISPIFLAFNLLRKPIDHYHRISGNFTIPFFRKEIALNINVFLPPLPLQQKFARIVEKIEAMRQSQNQSKQQIEDLFSALMQKAFRGEI